MLHSGLGHTPMTLKPEEFLQRAAAAEASAKRVPDPAYRDSYLELAKAFREMAELLGQSATQSDKEIQELVERMIRKTTGSP